MSASFQDHYAVLGVSRDASTEEIKSAHRRLIRDAHPDTDSGDEERAKALNLARDVLIDQVQRARFDASYVAELESTFIFSPTVLDFGDVHDDGDRTTVDVRVYFTESALPAEEVGFDSEFGSFWRIAFYREPSEDDPERSTVFYDLTFSTALQPDLSGEHHENLYLVSDRGVVGKLPLRINIVTAPATSAPAPEPEHSAAYDPPPMRSDPSTSRTGSSWVSTFTARREWPIVKRTVGTLLGCLVLIGGYLLVTHWNASVRASSSGHVANSPFPVDSPTLPQTASTAFNVTPRFISNATISNTSPIAGSLNTDAGNQASLTLQPTYSSFELTIQVDATSSGPSTDVVSALQNSVIAVSYPASAPLDLNNVEYKEAPLRTDVSSSGGSVSGTLVFAAVLPGSYGLGFANSGYIGVGNVAGPMVNTGNRANEFSSSAPGSGLGGASPDSALVVYMESQSNTDTVVSYGAMGSQGSGTPPLCITTSDGSMHKPTTTSVAQHDAGNGSWLGVGTMTFSVPTAAASAFSYGCHS